MAELQQVESADINVGVNQVSGVLPTLRLRSERGKFRAWLTTKWWSTAR